MGFWLWTEEFWLPEGTTWEDLKSNGTMLYPQVDELKYSIGLGLVLLVIRLFFESFVFLPIGYIGGFMNKQQALSTRILEHLNFGFASRGKFKRVAETAWRFTFYLTIWVIGLYVLRDEPQFKAVVECWRNWPNHNISYAMWWYYMVETGFYWSLLFSTFVIDVRRSDFWEMMLHHVVTILLLSMSWIINFVRIGTLILLCHDTADILLELGKLFRYARWSKAVTVIFAIFLATWIGTRLVYFPGWIIQPMIFEAPEYIQKSYRWENIFQRPIVPRIVVLMLCTLLVLHVFWTYILVKIAVKSVNSGVDDIREESDEDSDPEFKSDLEKKLEKKKTK